MKIIETLKQINLEPSKLRGQNFLVDNNIVEKIIKTAEIKKTDNILEVGPGLGVLTKLLSVKAKKVLAIEKDRRLFDFLQNEVGKNVKIINEDALKFDFNIAQEFFDNEDYEIVANLPYSITSNFFRLFLETDYPATKMTVMIQREVAERILERDGKSSLLSLAVKFFAEPQIAFHVSPGCFFPAPKVDSSVVVLRMKQPTLPAQAGNRSTDQLTKNIKQKTNNSNFVISTKPALSEVEWVEKSFLFNTYPVIRQGFRYLLLKTTYFKFIREAFSSKRKQMLGNIKSWPKEEVKKIILELGFDEKVRAEDIKFEQFLEIAEQLSKRATEQKSKKVKK
ncbi:MAG: 16S rRNA (adenine(1518)-N(6)/adenine(1519)-N(6))-dimethyltransferase RsmA [Patescibacteria group bacterium]